MEIGSTTGYSGNTVVGMVMKRKIIIASLSLFFIAAFWFIGVDASWFVEECPDCGFGRDIYQYRILTMPIHQKAWVYESLLSKVAIDVGASCHHPKLVRWHKHRYWGLIICAHPCINGIYRLSGDDNWYDEKAGAIVRQMAKENPSLQNEITERVLKNHDWKYWKDFLNRVKSQRGRTATISQ